MWVVTNDKIEMTENDYGVELPITVSGLTFAENDKLRFTIKKSVNGAAIIEKEATPTNGGINVVLSSADTAVLAPGTYVYNLDWYQDGAFMYNIISGATFKVVDKA